ncbi:hypothetical protein N5B55_05245 [Ralstonia pickettii]|uniref:hypothetical protein n=1 Tax=Ralstonia pickettii TaxID=329 RepID=UPI00271553FB|nr:hypothetical protein [Ralstonia pickettii]WKZ86361.1 hypothetical protein N5B55_05245 [Ralstonia pickettii]
MAGKKYIRNSGGQLQEEASVDISSGATDAGKIVALGTDGTLHDTVTGATVTSAPNRLVKLDASGRLDATVLPNGLGADTAVIVASEALSAGDYVNIWDNAGTAKVRKADASAVGKEAHGYVTAAYASGAAATVYFEGTNSNVSGQVAGPVFLSVTAGKGTNTAPTAAGQVVQRIGFAVSGTAVNFQSQPPILLA